MPGESHSAFTPLAKANEREQTDTGGKASTLARLLSNGLPVPDGFVVAHGADASQTALAAAASALGTPLIVRSSSSIEDSEHGNAPGLFLSVRDVAVDGLAAAVVAVRGSLGDAPDVPAGARMAVLVQTQLDGPRGTIYTRTAGNSVFIDAQDRAGTRFVASVDRDSGAVEADAGFPVPARELLAMALRCERTLDSQSLDIEWVMAEDGLWIVQARHLHQSNVQPLVPMEVFTFSRDDANVWRWDASHNPHPLSTAQAGLVEAVDRAGVAPYRMRVVSGHLYYTHADTTAVAFDSAEEVRDCFAQMAAVLNDAPTLDQALTAYVKFYELYAEFSPRLRRTNAKVSTADRRHIEELIRDVAPEWDVACAPYGDAAHDGDIRIARYLSNTAEQDDLYFGRAQQMVRARLLDLAAELALEDPQDVFWLPLPQLLSWKSGVRPPSPGQLASTAQQNRTSAQHQATLRMPLAIQAGKTIDDDRSVESERAIWRGYGAGGRVTATVTHASGTRNIPAGHALVAATVTPQMIVLARDAACIVSDFGSALGHAVAMANELGVPCVVGCRGANAQLRDGDQVLVDGTKGLVLRLRG